MFTRTNFRPACGQSSRIRSMTNTTIDQPTARHDPATDGGSVPIQNSPSRNTLHLRHDNCLRPVTWRWQRAQLLYEFGKTPAARWDDEHVGIALRHLRARTDRPGVQAEPLPAAVGDAIQQAFETWEPNGTPRWTLEAWLLTGKPMKFIAKKLSLPVETVTWYERLFFDTRDRLQTKSFITHAAIGREIHLPTPQDVGAIWRLFAYHLGPFALEAIIEDFTAAGRPDYSHLFEAGAEADNISLDRRLLQQAIRMILLPIDEFRKMLVHALNDPQTRAGIHSWDELMDQLAAPEMWARYATAGSEDEKPAENVDDVPTDGSRTGEAA